MNENERSFAALAGEVQNLKNELRAVRATAKRSDLIELLVALGHFMSCFEMVFDNDWEMTKTCVSEDEEGWFISKKGTFIEPLVDDESNNWGNRGSLLASYRHLVACMEKCGLEGGIGGYE